MTWTAGLRSDLIPWFKWIVSYVQSYDRTAQVTSAFRSRSEQRRLYDRYLRGLSKYPAAPPGSSMHELGRAIDIKADLIALQAAGVAWEYYGGTWGGQFGGYDPIHFEG